MAKNVLGIDISDFSIEAVVLEKEKGHLAVKSYARFRLSPDIVDDGRVISPDKLQDALSRMFKNAKPHSMEGYKKVILSIPESKTFSKIFSLPKNLKDKELLKAVKNKAEEIIPESSDNLTAVIKPLPNNGDNKEVFYSAAEIEVIESLVEVFKKLGMEVEGIVTEAVSAFAGLSQDFKKTTTLLLDIGARTTIASIFDKNGIRDSINIDIAGNNLTGAIANKLGVNYSVAEEQKKKIGLTPDGSGEVMLVIQGQLQPVTDELQRFISYYEESYNQKVEQIVIVGGSADLKGVDKYFGDNLSRPAYIGQPFVDSKFLPQEVSAHKYLNVLGLAKLAHQKMEVDFYEPYNRAQKKRDKVDIIETPEEEVSEKKFKLPMKLWQLIVLVLIVVAFASLIIFREKFYSLINPGEAPVESTPETETIPEELTLEDIFPRSIVVSTFEHENIDNFVLGEYYTIGREIEGVAENLEYLDALEYLVKQEERVLLPLVNTDYTIVDAYIIPKVVDYEEVSVTPEEVDFTVGDSLKLEVNYSFVSIPFDAIKSLLEADLSNVSDEQIKTIGYTVNSHSLNSNGDTFSVTLDVE